MKSLERLRGCTFIGAGKVDEYIDEIECEIAERYVPMPVDGDGVTIHIGDVVAAQDEQPFEVRAFQLDALGWFAIERLGSQWHVNQLRHVKPRMLEDVLRELMEDAREDLRNDFSVDAYAAEIRELLGVGE